MSQPSTSPTQTGKTPTTSGFAIASLVFSFIMAPLGLLFGLIALRKINKSQGELTGQVLAIVGLAISIPICLVFVTLGYTASQNFSSFACRAKQSEVKATLKALHQLELNHFDAHGRYAVISELENHENLIGPIARYEYRVTRATEGSYTALATALHPDLNGDSWTIDQAGNLENTTVGCPTINSQE